MTNKHSIVNDVMMRQTCSFGISCFEIVKIMSIRFFLREIEIVDNKRSVLPVVPDVN